MEIHPYVNRRPGRPLTSSALISMRSFFALFPPHVYELHHHEVFMTREPVGPDIGPQFGPFPYPHPHPRQGYSLFVIRKFFKPCREPRGPICNGSVMSLGAQAPQGSWGSDQRVPRGLGHSFPLATRSHLPLLPTGHSFPFLLTLSHSFPFGTPSQSPFVSMLRRFDFLRFVSTCAFMAAPHLILDSRRQNEKIKTISISAAKSETRKISTMTATTSTTTTISPPLSTPGAD